MFKIIHRRTKVKYAILDKNNNQVKIVESNNQIEEILRNYPLGYSAVVVDQIKIKEIEWI